MSVKILDSVSSIVKQVASGNVFFYQGTTLLASVRQTKEVRRDGNRLYISLDNGNEIAFDIVLLTLIQADPSRSITLSALDPQNLNAAAQETKINTAYEYLTEEVFVSCCPSTGGGGGASISNDPYGASWAADTTGGASRQALYNKFEAVVNPGVVAASTSNAREDNYSPAGWPASGQVLGKVLEITPTNANNIVSIGGLTSGSAGRIVTICNKSANQLLIIDHESPTSTAANRFRLQHNQSYFVLPGRDITFIYNGTRWSQMSQGNWAGLDLVDHLTSAPQNAIAAATGYSTGLFSWISSGTSSGVRSAGNLGPLDLGGAQLQTGTTATGNTLGAVSVRNGGGASALDQNGQFPLLFLAVVDAVPVPTLAQDVVCGVGLESSSATWNGFGYIWKTPAFATFANVWEIDVVNVAGGLAVNVVTAVPTTTKQYLGIWNHGNNGDVTFFSSSDGITYNSVYRFTRTTGNFGGYPKIRLASTVGTTSKSWTTHMMGVSMNQKR